jgi:putative endonuclease
MTTAHRLDRRVIGAETEERAARLLEEVGFRILLRNYRWRGGELDLVARLGELLVIAEVRLRSSAQFGGAAASITAAKRRRLLLTAQHLLLRRPQLSALTVRFDAILCGGPDAPLEWLQGVM